MARTWPVVSRGQPLARLPPGPGNVSDALAAGLGDRLRQLWTSQVGAVVAAHVGPGLVAVVVHRVGERPAATLPSA
jgi:hypothetical protein